MTTTLVACSNCRRHFRANEPRCPFCSLTAIALLSPQGVLTERRSRAAVLALATAGVVAACTPPTPTPDSPKPPPPAAAPEQKLDPVTAPSASESAQAPVAPEAPPVAQNPAGAQPDGRLAAAYGAPPPAPVATETTPGPEVTIRGVSIVGGSLPNAERVVNAMQPGFRSCYARGLKERPDAQGDVIVKIRIGSAGQILGVSVQQTARVPATVASCMSTRAAASQFDVPPGGKGVEVVVPTTLAKP